MRLRRARAILGFSMRMKLAFVVLALMALAIASACSSDDSEDADANATSDAIGEATGEPAGQPGPDAPTVTINSTEIAVGSQDESVLAVLNFNAPGLGAWTVDVTYDNSVVSVIACDGLPAGNVCNPAFDDDTVRVVGAVATGLEGDTVIGRIIFQCDGAGESPLDLFIETFADGTIGDPLELVPHVEHGAITCTE